MYNWKEIAPATFKIPMKGGMRVPGLVIGTESLFSDIEIEKPIEQVCHVAHLPGIVGYSIAMPDIHWGYGFPIGGVAAMDPADGVVSPGGVGYDINCGVRLALVKIPFYDLSEKKKHELIQHIFKSVPSGVGGHHQKAIDLKESDYRAIAAKGALWMVENGFGLPEDLQHCESLGCLPGADSDAVSSLAKERGAKQLGTVGSGNHFVEIGVVDKLYLPEIASSWGVAKGMTYLLIHSGSRGFGHQVCQDTLDDYMQKGYAEGLPDKQLIAAPIQSGDGKRYLEAMAMAANFAFCNRQRILHEVRMSFQEVLGSAPEDVKLLYDVCHNIAKFETHEVEGKMKELLVHRKGATRAYGPGARELAPCYQQTGQPVLVPGDMGRASHLLVGSGAKMTWSSCCHGAGRARSRHQSLKAWSGRDPMAHMKSQHVEVLASSRRTIVEEMPDAYKEVDQVVEAVEEAGLARRVAKLKPHLVVKG